MALMDTIMSKLTGPKNVMSDQEVLMTYYLEFNSSIQRRWMTTGERYYTGNNDIKYNGDSPEILGANVGLYTDSDFSNHIDANGLADNKLSHSQMKLLVDEKVNYLLSKPYSLVSNDKNFIEAVKKAIGKRFNYTLTKLGYEASNKGIAWLQPYIDLQGALKFMVVQSEQCCPIWTSNDHEELEGMIRYYNVVTYVGKTEKVVTKVEYWTSNGLEFYEIYEGKLIIDVNAYLQYGIDDGSAAPHYIKNGEHMYWGRVPFIPFKNNITEYPDVRVVKSLVDNYDDSRSEVANFIQDVKNLVYVLRGYGGEDLASFMKDLKKNRALKVDNDGGVDTINPTMDITAAQAHYDQLSRDIIKFAQGIPKDLEKLGNNPSGTALRFHYSGIDLKCNAMENEFKFGFENMLYFVNQYLVLTGKGDFSSSECDIVFNRDVAINIDGAIANCVASKDIVSKETLLANHPWVSDVEEEMKRLEEEQPEPQTSQNVPGGPVDNPMGNREHDE